MNVVPKAAPAATAPSTPAQDSRAKAIAAFNASSQAQQAPVLNPTNVSPEEMSALGAQGQTNTNEAAPEVTGDKPAKAEDPLSSQYANLARKEKALRSQIQQFKADQAKFKAEQDARSASPAQTFDESKYIPRDRLKSNPLDVLIEEGLSYDDITAAVLNQSSIQTDPAVRAQLARMEAQIQKAEEAAKRTQEAYENQQKASYQQALNQIKNETKQLVYTDPSYEMIKETNSTADVVELIEKTFQTEGVLLSVEEACQAVEEHLLEEASKLTKIKKLQQRLGQSAAAQPATQTKQPQQTSKQNTTLTNSMSSTKPMSSRERAIAAMEGRLKG